MREVISVHVGQAGVQIGNACCESLFHSRRIPHEHYRVLGLQQRVILYLTFRWQLPKWRVINPINRGVVHRRAWSQRRSPFLTTFYH